MYVLDTTPTAMLPERLEEILTKKDRIMDTQERKDFLSQNSFKGENHNLTKSKKKKNSN